MTCDEARTSIHFHLDGDDHHHVQRAREHTHACIRCEQNLLDLQEVERALRDMKRYAAPADLKARIIQAVSERPQKRPLGRMVL